MPLSIYGTGSYGQGGFAGNTYGPLEVTSATSLSSFEVRVDFNQPLDVNFPPFLSLANYAIPGLTINTVLFDGPFSVRLITTEQSNTTYTVTVSQGTSDFGTNLDPAHDSATFGGNVGPLVFKPVALSTNRVRVLFYEPMLANSALTTPANYVITTLDGALIGINQVIQEQVSPVSVVLVLTTPITETKTYQLTIFPIVKTADGNSVTSAPQTFSWEFKPPRVTIPISSFSGEVTGGLFGNPAGLLFFSPALLAPIGGSSIKIDSVKSCTKSYDTYTFPVLEDPPLLYTFGNGAPFSTVGGTYVLWAPFPQNAEARIELGYNPSDGYSGALDGKCVATLTEPLMASKISLTNNTYWGIFGGIAQPFILADTLAPISPGPTTTVTIVP